MKTLVLLILVSYYSSICNAVSFDDSRVFKVMAQEWSGTGFNVIAPSGKIYTITNKHVCDKQKFLIQDENGTPRIHIVLKIYDKADLCVLSSTSLSGFKMADTHIKGQSIQVLGYPLGIRSLTSGSIIGYGHDASFEDVYFSSDAKSNYGSSGSPVLDDKDNVIGVVEGINDKNQQSVIVPLEFLQDALRDM